MKKITRIGGALRQVVASCTQQNVVLPRGTTEIDVLARGGDLIVAAGDGPQDVEFDGMVLPNGKTETIFLTGRDPQVSVALAGQDVPAMLQIVEYTRVENSENPLA